MIYPLRYDVEVTANLLRFARQILRRSCLHGSQARRPLAFFLHSRGFIAGYPFPATTSLCLGTRLAMPRNQLDTLRTVTTTSYEDVPLRVYMLGTGSIGKFIAHSIRGVADPPPVTLLYHRPDYKNRFESEGRVIKLKKGKNVEERSGYEAELLSPRGARHEGDKRHDHIHNLIVTVKAQDTVRALEPLVHRLSRESTILFMQNGMGVVEDCDELLFPDPTTRPTYVIGVNSHGVYAQSTTEATHAGEGAIMLGLVKRESSNKGVNVEEGEERDGSRFWTPSSRYLLRVLTRIPLLAAVVVSPTQLIQAQAEKLAVNCLINPLTAMMDCRNGDLLHNFAVSRTMFLLLSEISLVVQAFPELQGVPNVKLRFSPERLQHIAFNIAQTTKDNISSMLQDMRRGKRTEIEYINGYIVRKGEAMGIKPVMNYMLMQMVIGKQQLINREVNNYNPFSRDALDRRIGGEEGGAKGKL